jgi:hypothetical protein
MEERLAREDGADAKNAETFGDCLEGWSFEDACEANAKLAASPLKASEQCPSTCPGSVPLSECPSSDSESSTPRAKTQAASTYTFNIKAPTFQPANILTIGGSMMRADAPAFYPDLVMQTM